MSSAFATFRQPGWNQRFTLIILAIFAIGGIALIADITDVGPWAFSDSSAYLATAENIADGRGPVLQNSHGEYELLPLHPPLYPMVVSLPMMLGAGALQSTRWLNAILFGLTIFLAGWSTFHFTHSFWLSISASGLFLATYEPVRAYSGAMAEGLFLFLGFTGLFVLARSINAKKLIVWNQIAAGVLIGLAILTRYAGLAFLGIGVVTLMIFSTGKFISRLRQVLAFLVPGVMVPALWLVPVYLKTHTFGDRQIGDLVNIWPKIPNYFEAFFETIGTMLPYFNRGNHLISPVGKLIVGAIFAIVLIVVPIIILSRRKQAMNENGLLAWGFTLLGFITAYVALHLGAYLIAVTQPDVDGRLLLPIYLAAVMLLPVGFSFWGRLLRKEWVTGVVFLALALVTVWYFHGKMKNYLFDMHHYGDGYTSKRWNENPIFDQVRTLDSFKTLGSYDAGLILFYTGRYPEVLVQYRDQDANTLDLSADQGLVLFTLNGEHLLGADGYDNFVLRASELYEVVYRDNEGIVFQSR